MNSETTLDDYMSRPLNDHMSEYVFDRHEFAQRFVDEWRDKIGVDEVVWMNDDGTFSVIVNSRG